MLVFPFLFGRSIRLAWILWISIVVLLVTIIIGIGVSRQWGSSSEGCLLLDFSWWCGREGCRLKNLGCGWPREDGRGLGYQWGNRSPGVRSTCCWWFLGDDTCDSWIECRAEQLGQSWPPRLWFETRRYLPDSPFPSTLWRTRLVISYDRGSCRWLSSCTSKRDLICLLRSWWDAYRSWKDSCCWVAHTARLRILQGLRCKYRFLGVRCMLEVHTLWGRILAHGKVRDWICIFGLRISIPSRNRLDFAWGRSLSLGSLLQALR